MLPGSAPPIQCVPIGSMPFLDWRVEASPSTYSIRPPGGSAPEALLTGALDSWTDGASSKRKE